MRQDVRPGGREELRRPGMRRILDAIKAVKEERPGLVEEASVAAGGLAPRRSSADPGGADMGGVP
jgi:hypothetical protein